MRFLKIFSFIVPGVLMIACDPSQYPILQVEGHYEGVLTSHLTPSSYSQESVNADIASVRKSQGPVVLKDEHGSPRLTLTVSNVTDHSLMLQSSFGMSRGVTLALSQDSSCYTGIGDTKVTFCATGPEVSLEILSVTDNTELVSLVLHHVNPGDVALPKEMPKVFTLSDAIQTARAKSFASRIEFEHVVQAKARSRAAYLHLLPQLTLGTVANNLTPSFSTLLGSIGDLAPFLLPNRWIQADAAAQQSKAEQDTSLIMRLDMGAQVEGLAYAYLRDRKTRDLTQDILNRATSIRNEVKVREDLGQLPLGSTGNLNSIVNQMQQNLSVLNQVTVEDLATISQTLGFYDPGTVKDVVIDHETVPIGQAPTVDASVINVQALKIAPELNQMDDLIVAAHDTKKAAYFSWLDPYGDPSLGLGFALPAQVQVLSSQIQELGVDRQQLQSIISLKVTDATTDYGQALQAYQLATQGMTIQQSRLDLMMSNLNAGVKVDFFGLIGVLQDYLGGEIAIASAEANFRVARAEVDRLLLSGYYAKF